MVGLQGVAVSAGDIARFKSSAILVKKIGGTLVLRMPPLNHSPMVYQGERRSLPLLQGIGEIPDAMSLLLSFGLALASIRSRSGTAFDSSIP